LARDWRINRDGDPEHNDSERWLITYADLITVLLIFFIVMYALSAKISAKNFQQLAKSLNSSLTKKAKESKSIDPFSPDVQQDSLTQSAEEVKRAIAPFKGRSNVRVDLTSQGIVISLADTSFFDIGRTDLKEDSKPTLLAIARSIATDSMEISIEGHTDNTRGAGTNTSNWVLAATRASNVMSYLSTAGKIPAKRFKVVSYAEFRPLFPNDTPEHRALNRRVDIVIQKEAPKPALTPPPEAFDTLTPAFGTGASEFGAPSTPPGFSGGSGTGPTNTVPNPFGNL
jgi:chemotaxis protein MotB